MHSVKQKCPKNQRSKAVIMGIRESKLRKLGSGRRGYKRVEEDRGVAPRGYVPIWVGVDEDSRKRFMVRTRALEDADFCELLGRSAEEYGFRNDGILRISFEAQDFDQWMITRSKHNVKKVKPVKLTDKINGVKHFLSPPAKLTTF